MGNFTETVTQQQHTGNCDVLEFHGVVKHRQHNRRQAPTFLGTLHEHSERADQCNPLSFPTCAEKRDLFLKIN